MVLSGFWSITASLTARRPRWPRPRGPWVESTTGAVVGRPSPIWTHSVSSRRSANRTCGFPASGSLRDHAFAHGGSRVDTDGCSRRNTSCALVGMAVSPLIPATRCRNNHQRGRHAPGAALARRLLPCPARRYRQFVDACSTSSFACTCSALRPFGGQRRTRTELTSLSEPDHTCAMHATTRANGTYRYQFLVDDRVVCHGITTDLYRRQREHQRRWPDGHIEQVGDPTSHREAWEWQRDQPADQSALAG